MPQFPYGSMEIAHLKDRDPVLGAVIDRIGRIEREVQPDLWPALVHSIVSQQISNAAAATVWRRLSERFGDITPSRLMETALMDWQACGIPRRKAEWLHHLGSQVASGALDFHTCGFSPRFSRASGSPWYKPPSLDVALFSRRFNPPRSVSSGGSIPR